MPAHAAGSHPFRSRGGNMQRPYYASVALAAMLELASLACHAGTTLEDTIRKSLEPRMGQNVKIDSVTKTPYAGLYEVRVGSDIFYTDEKGDYLVVGKIVDMHTYKDLTAERVDQFNRIRFADLPFDSAVKMVKGDGKRVIAVFEDPNCSYCKKFREHLKSMDNITVYTFMLNILADDSAAKSANIWCSADRDKAWDEWMLEGKMPAAAKADCKTPNDSILALGKKLHILGTPTIFFADGTRSASALDAKALEAKLAAVK
jgi:thiol:disulfide interchange protein DsbC